MPLSRARANRQLNSQGAVDISVAGKTWGLPLTAAPITHGQFVIVLPTQNDVSQLQRLLVSPG